NCRGHIVSRGYNMLARTPVRSSCTFDANTGDQLGIGIDRLNLGPLKDNGGPISIWSHELLPGSSAIDAGNPGVPGTEGDSCEGTDQRGADRPRDGNGDGTYRCDAGALETGPAPPHMCGDGIAVAGEQ